jgi:hypothetical protein
LNLRSAARWTRLRSGLNSALAEAAPLFQVTGNIVYFPWCLEGLAALAAAQGDFERAAELAGARDALREQIGVFLPPVYPARYERTLQVARARHGPFGRMILYQT